MAQMDARIQDPITTPDSEDITNITTLSPPAALWQWRQLSFSDNYLKTVHRHWLSFPPPPHAAHYFLAVLYICIMILGIFGNSLVIFMFIKLVLMKMEFLISQRFLLKELLVHQGYDLRGREGCDFRDTWL